MKLRLLVLSVCLYSFCCAQDSVTCTRSYDREGPLTWADSFFFRIPNTLFVNFNSSFDDSVIIKINGHVVLDRYLQTNHSIDLAGSICVSFDDSSDCKTMTVQLVNARKYFTEKLDFHFKALDIWTQKQKP
jgi:hypothetical protein